MKNFKTGLGSYQEISRGATGITDLFSSLNSGTTVTEGINTAGELVEGLAGIAMACRAFGLPGLIVSTVVLAATAAIDYEAREQKERIKYNETEAGKIQSSMQAFVMSESDARSFVQDIGRAPVKKVHRWRLPVSPEAENFKRYGREAYTLTVPIPVARKDNVIKPNLPPWIPQLDEQPAPARKNYLEKTFDLEQLLVYTGMTRGINGFNEAVGSIVAQAKKIDKQFHINISGMVNAAVKESSGFLLRMSNEGREVSNGNTTAARKRNGKFYSQGDNRTVNINLSKPMIENFTINVKDVKEGINDFKHRVEEALLEILNSVNISQ